jgi:hypothetical protein
MSDSIIVIPCHFERVFNKWTDRDAGGGFHGSISVSEFENMITERDDSGKFWIPDTDQYLSDTRNHYCLVVDPETGMTDRVIISMSSTQIKVSRKWLARMGKITMPGANGPFNPPSYSHKYELTTRTEGEGQKTWKVPEVSIIGPLGEGEEQIYEDAKAFYKLVDSGNAKVSEPTNDAPGNKLEMGPDDIEM